MSLDLFLVRHAIACEADPIRWPDDGDRPLTEEGIVSLRKAARGLAKVAPVVELVLSSPFVRAVQTAEVLAQEAGWPSATMLDELAADVSSEDVISALSSRALPGSIALVGHEPSLSMLAGTLIGDGDIELKKGAVARLAVGSLKPGGARLRWLLPPKVLRAL